MDYDHYAPGHLLPLKGVEAISRRFLGVDYELSTIRQALKLMGVAGSEGRGAGGRGRALYYDPLVCWVVATIYYRRDEKPEQLIKIVDARLRGMNGRFPVDDDRVNQRSAAVYYSFITDLEWGMDVRRIGWILSEQPDAILLTMSKGGALLSRSFAAYREAVDHWTSVVLPADGDPDLRREAFETARRDHLEQLANMLVQHRTLLPLEAGVLRAIHQDDFRL